MENGGGGGGGLDSRRGKAEEKGTRSGERWEVSKGMGKERGIKLEGGGARG
jgi:hypothetical protein